MLCRFIVFVEHPPHAAVERAVPESLLPEANHQWNRSQRVPVGAKSCRCFDSPQTGNRKANERGSGGRGRKGRKGQEVGQQVDERQEKYSGEAAERCGWRTLGSTREGPGRKRSQRNAGLFGIETSGTNPPCLKHRE